MVYASILSYVVKYLSFINSAVKQGLKLEEAVNRAIDQCIEEDILKSYLLKNKGEVMSMILTEYNEKLQIRLFVKRGERKE